MRNRIVLLSFLSGSLAVSDGIYCRLNSSLFFFGLFGGVFRFFSGVLSWSDRYSLALSLVLSFGGFVCCFVCCFV